MNKKNVSLCIKHSENSGLRLFTVTGQKPLSSGIAGFLFIAVAMLFLLTVQAKADDSLWSGTGIILGIENKEPVVVGVFPNSPAGKAGVKPGDIIVEYNYIRSFEKAELFKSQTLNRALTAKPGRKVGLRLRRGGRNMEINLTTAEFPINYANIPRSNFRSGKISEVKNRSGKTSFKKSDGIEWGDKFLVFRGREYLGNVAITEVHSDYSKIKFIGRLNALDTDKLRQADLYLLENSPRHFNKYQKPPKMSSHPTYKKYWNDVVKHKYEILTTAEITKINKTTGKISIVTHRASSAGPGSIRVYDVKMDLYYSTGKTEFLPEGTSGSLKVGDVLDIFYKEENGRKVAYLIVLMSSRK